MNGAASISAQRPRASATSRAAGVLALVLAGLFLAQLVVGAVLGVDPTTGVVVDTASTITTAAITAPLCAWATILGVSLLRGRRWASTWACVTFCVLAVLAFLSAALAQSVLLLSAAAANLVTGVLAGLHPPPRVGVPGQAPAGAPAESAPPGA